MKGPKKAYFNYPNCPSKLQDKAECCPLLLPDICVYLPSDHPPEPHSCILLLSSFIHGKGQRKGWSLLQLLCTHEQGRESSL